MEVISNLIKIRLKPKVLLNHYMLCVSLHKVLFTEQPETYYKWDNWPPESDRNFFLRLCSEVPLLEDTLMCILVISLSRDLPLGPADAMELADHLVKRAAGVRLGSVASREDPTHRCCAEPLHLPSPREHPAACRLSTSKSCHINSLLEGLAAAACGGSVQPTENWFGRVGWLPHSENAHGDGYDKQLLLPSMHSG